MTNAMLSQVIQIVIMVVAFIPALVLHEVAHGYAAYKLGDPTAKNAGRLSLNPLRHVDPFGTVILPGCLIAMSVLGGGGGMLFGYAKPVPYNPRYFKDIRTGELIVGLVGPATNLALSLVGAAIAWGGIYLYQTPALPAALGLSLIHIYTAVDVDDAVGERAYEMSIVTDEHDGSLEAAQRLLADVDARNVQVVGGLVEAQQRRGSDEHLGERQTRLLATGKHAHLLVDVISLDEEGAEQRSGPVSYTHLDVYKRQLSAWAGEDVEHPTTSIPMSTQRAQAMTRHANRVFVRRFIRRHILL